MRQDFAIVLWAALLTPILVYLVNKRESRLSNGWQIACCVGILFGVGGIFALCIILADFIKTGTF